MTKDTMPDYDDVPPLEALDEADASAAFELDVPPDTAFDALEDLHAPEGACAAGDAPDGGDEDRPVVVPADAGDFAVETAPAHGAHASRSVGGHRQDLFHQASGAPADR